MHIGAHVLHDAPATLFIANATIECRTYEIGPDSLGVRAPSARASGSFTRIQSQLDPELWLDADAVLTECKRSGDEWLWRLSFSFVREPTPLKLLAFLRHRPSRTPAPPANPHAEPAMRPRGAVPTRPPRSTGDSNDPSPRATSRMRVSAISEADLRSLYQAALAQVEREKS